MGTIVSLKEYNIPHPMQWRRGPLGRITAVHPEKDGTVRVVRVRSRTGGTKRAVWKSIFAPCRTSSKQPRMTFIVTSDLLTLKATLQEGGYVESVLVVFLS